MYNDKNDLRIFKKAQIYFSLFEALGIEPRAMSMLPAEPHLQPPYFSLFFFEISSH
jgi:hypothetical protein